MTIPRFLKTLLGLVILLGALWVIESQIKEYQGVVLLSLDIMLELAAALVIIRSALLKDALGRTAQIFLSLFFIGIAWGDVAWTLAFYILKLDSRLPVVSINVAGGYASGFLFGALGIFFSTTLNRVGLFASRIVLLPLLLTTPICFKTLVLPLIKSSNGNLFTIFNIGEFIAISTSFILLNLALGVLLSTRQLAWSIFSGGMVSVIFGDWAMRVEKILGTTPVFGVYELYWTFGVSICAYPFLVGKVKLNKIERYFYQSLLCQYKTWASALIFLSILLLSFSQYGNLEAIKMISITCGVGAISAALAGHFLVDKIEMFSHQLASLVGPKGLTEISSSANISALPTELVNMYEQSFAKKIEEIKSREDEAHSMQLALERSKIASQVAHDIRSPLAALSTVTMGGFLKGEDKDEMIQMATLRIHEIASELLDINRTQKANQKTESIPILALVHEIVAEKKVQMNGNKDISFDISASDNVKAACAPLRSAEIKRILSNLIDNATEASPTLGGAVGVSVEIQANDLIEVSVTDTGAGISSDIVESLNRHGFSHGKANGNGLGVRSAQRTLRNVGGDLEIRSALGAGTVVVLKFPSNLKTIHEARNEMPLR